MKAYEDSNKTFTFEWVHFFSSKILKMIMVLVFLLVAIVISTHEHHLFHREVKNYFSCVHCTWVKNGFRAGDFFGCPSPGRKGGR